MKIGQRIRRVRSGAKWHLIESIVADDAVTKCGRRMRDETGPVELADVTLPGGNCQRCG